MITSDLQDISKHMRKAKNNNNNRQKTLQRILELEQKLIKN